MLCSKTLCFHSLHVSLWWVSNVCVNSCGRLLSPSEGRLASVEHQEEICSTFLCKEGSLERKRLGHSYSLKKLLALLCLDLYLIWRTARFIDFTSRTATLFQSLITNIQCWTSYSKNAASKVALSFRVSS